MDPRFKAKVQDVAVWARLEEEACLRLQNQRQARSEGFILSRYIYISLSLIETYVWK